MILLHQMILDILDMILLHQLILDIIIGHNDIDIASTFGYMLQFRAELARTVIQFWSLYNVRSIRCNTSTVNTLKLLFLMSYLI